MTKPGVSATEQQLAEQALAPSSTQASAQAKPRVRDRIIDAASELFYHQGINCVGIDAIVGEAGTNKMSLYRNFASKDELVVEYLQEHEEEHFQRWDDIAEVHPDNPRAQIEALFELTIQLGREKGICGCPSANAAIELRGADHPAVEIIFAGREKGRKHLLKLAKAAGARSPDVLADGLAILLEGCVMSRVTFPDKKWPAKNLMAILKSLLDAELGERDEK